MSASKNKGGLNIGSQNAKGNIYNNTGGYNDQRTRNVRNTYGDENRYYTDSNDQYYDHSTNYNRDYYAPATHYHGPVNNVQHGQIVTGTVNGGNFFKPKMGDYNNQGPVAQPEGANPPRPAAPAGPGYDQYPPPGRRPGPAPAPYDQDFTATDPAVPQYQDFSQQRGPARPNLKRHPYSGPDNYQGWGQHQQQGPPPAFPPRGPQGYPQHPPQNPNFRPTGAPFPPPRQQRQPHPQRQQWQGPEQGPEEWAEEWAGQYAYEQGRAHLKQNSPASWDTNGSEDSDTSDEDSDDETIGNVQRVEDPNRPDQAWMHRGPPQPAPERRQAPPPASVAAYDDHQDVNDLLSSLSLDNKKKKKKRDPRNPKKN